MSPDKRCGIRTDGEAGGQANLTTGQVFTKQQQIKPNGMCRVAIPCRAGAGGPAANRVANG